MNQRHKCSIKEADDRLTRYIKDDTDPFNPHRKITNYREEPFEIEKYLNDLKDQTKEYVKLNRDNKISNVIKDQSNSQYNNNQYNPYNNNVQYNQYNNNSYYNQSNNQYNNQYDQYTSQYTQDSFTSKGNKKGKRNKYQDFKNQELYSKSLHNKNNNYYNNNEIRVVAKEICSDGTTSYFNSTLEKDNNNNSNIKNNNNNTYNNNNISSSFNLKSNMTNSISQPVKKTGKPQMLISNYTSYFEYHYKEIKDYITEKIKTQEVEESEVIIPREVGYQLIVIIDRNTSKDNSELKFLTNFGFGFSIIDEILNYFAKTEGYSFREIFDRLPFNKVLILYKFLHICYLKENGNFFKFGK